MESARASIVDICMTPEDAAAAEARRTRMGWTLQGSVRLADANECFKWAGGKADLFDTVSVADRVVVLLWAK